MRIRASPSCLVPSLDRTRSTNTYLQTKNERQLRPSVRERRARRLRAGSSALSLRALLNATPGRQGLLN